MPRRGAFVLVGRLLFECHGGRSSVTVAVAHAEAHF